MRCSLRCGTWWARHQLQHGRRFTTHFHSPEHFLRKADRVRDYYIPEPTSLDFKTAHDAAPDITVSFRALNESLTGPCRMLQFLDDHSWKKQDITLWSHRLFRGPCGEKVKVWHAYSLAQSEILARKFWNEPILGFDVEWAKDMPGFDDPAVPPNARISHLQLACEDKVGIFHIGCIDGDTTDQLFAPSLRKIIESPNIAKMGVSILAADFGRLRRGFRLWPRGAFELNHLDHITNYPEAVPETYKGLDVLLQKYMSLDHLKVIHNFNNGLRGPVGHASVQYIQAATDAYAGYMLFHRINRKRLSMDIVPPLPLYAEDQLSVHGRAWSWLRLHLPDKDGGGLHSMRVDDFFHWARFVQSRIARTMTELSKKEQTWLIWNLVRESRGEGMKTTPALTGAVDAAINAAGTEDAERGEELSEPPIMHTGVPSNTQDMIVLQAAYEEVKDRMCSPPPSSRNISLSGFRLNQRNEELRRSEQLRKAIASLKAQPQREAEPRVQSEPQETQLEPELEPELESALGHRWDQQPVPPSESKTLVPDASAQETATQKAAARSFTSATAFPNQGTAKEKLMWLEQFEEQLEPEAQPKAQPKLQNEPKMKVSLPLPFTPWRPLPRDWPLRQQLVWLNEWISRNRFGSDSSRLPDAAIDNITARRPETVEELIIVPGVMPFLNACAMANVSFLGFILKATEREKKSLVVVQGKVARGRANHLEARLAKASIGAARAARQLLEAEII